MRLFPTEPVERVAVTVTFLRMERPPATPSPPFPPAARVERRMCSVSEFRHLYNTVGASHLWWLRRTLPDADLALHLSKPALAIHVLSDHGALAGFHELERTQAGVVNLNYFGLFPDALGRGLGRALLRHALDVAWSWKPQMVTVNTCTADHPRALPTYEAAGFQKVRAVEEIWEVPTRLGLTIPKGLRRL